MEIKFKFKYLLWALRYGEYWWGWESYPNKPKFLATWTYYNGYHYVIHIGNFYAGVSE